MKILFQIFILQHFYFLTACKDPKSTKTNIKKDKVSNIESLQLIDGSSLEVHDIELFSSKKGRNSLLNILPTYSKETNYLEFYSCLKDSPGKCKPTKEKPEKFLFLKTYNEPLIGTQHLNLRACSRFYSDSSGKTRCGPWKKIEYTQEKLKDLYLSELMTEENFLESERTQIASEIFHLLFNYKKNNKTLYIDSKDYDHLIHLIDPILAMGEDLFSVAITSDYFTSIESEIIKISEDNNSSKLMLTDTPTDDSILFASTSLLAVSVLAGGGIAYQQNIREKSFKKNIEKLNQELKDEIIARKKALPNSLESLEANYLAVKKNYDELENRRKKYFESTYYKDEDSYIRRQNRHASRVKIEISNLEADLEKTTQILSENQTKIEGVVNDKERRVISLEITSLENKINKINSQLLDKRDILHYFSAPADDKIFSKSNNEYNAAKKELDLRKDQFDTRKSLHSTIEANTKADFSKEITSTETAKTKANKLKYKSLNFGGLGAIIGVSGVIVSSLSQLPLTSNNVDKKRLAEEKKLFTKLEELYDRLLYTRFLKVRHKAFLNLYLAKKK